MTIKKQFTLLITGIILVPAICMIFLPLYHYFNSPQRYMLREYEQIRESGFEIMTENDWDELKEKILYLPPKMQAAVFIDNTAVISTIPEIVPETTFLPKELFEFIRNTSEEYDYHFQAPDQRHERNKEIKSKRRPPYTVLYRSKVQDRQKKKGFSSSLYYPMLLIFFIFETFCIIVLIVISRIISSSITMLEQNTKRIADGDLNVELQMPEKTIFINEITDLTNSLEKMKCSLKEEELRRERFIMGISHDLRTPVALIKGYTEAITDGVVSDTENINKSLSIIHSKTEQLESMINDLIDYVKISSQDFRKSFYDVNLYSFLTEYSEAMINAGSVFKRNFEVSLDIPSDIQVPMDKKLISRVLENLISNALRYTSENDSISFSASIKTDDSDNTKTISISIRDTGLGFSEEEKQHIFDLFYRASNSRREQGMGIGLSVVKTILELHEWNINVVSEKGKGSEFTIMIPVKD